MQVNNEVDQLTTLFRETTEVVECSEQTIRRLEALLPKNLLISLLCRGCVIGGSAALYSCCDRIADSLSVGDVDIYTKPEMMRTLIHIVDSHVKTENHDNSRVIERTKYIAGGTSLVIADPYHYPIQLVCTDYTPEQLVRTRYVDALQCAIFMNTNNKVVLLRTESCKTALATMTISRFLDIKHKSQDLKQRLARFRDWGFSLPADFQTLGSLGLEYLDIQKSDAYIVQLKSTKTPKYPTLEERYLKLLEDAKKQPTSTTPIKHIYDDLFSVLDHYFCVRPGEYGNTKQKTYKYVLLVAPNHTPQFLQELRRLNVRVITPEFASDAISTMFSTIMNDIVACDNVQKRREKADTLLELMGHLDRKTVCTQAESTDMAKKFFRQE